MKIQGIGELHAKISRKYEKNGETVIVATVVIHEGNFRGFDMFKNFETADKELIEKIKSIPEKTKVKASGYVNCSYYVKDDGSKMAFTKLNLISIELEENITNTNTKITQNTDNQQDDLTF